MITAIDVLHCSLLCLFLHQDKDFCHKALCSSTTRMPMQQLVTIVTKGWHLGSPSWAAAGRLEGLFTSTIRCNRRLHVFFNIHLLPLPLFISIFLHHSASLSFISLFTLSHALVFVPFPVHSPVSHAPFPHLPSFQCVLFSPSSASWPLPYLSSLIFLPALIPPGDIQPCSCPVSRNRLSLPVPERLICPAGPWQRLPHAQWRWTYTCWTPHVLLLCHFACTGTNPQRDYFDAILIIWLLSVEYCRLNRCHSYSTVYPCITWWNRWVLQLLKARFIDWTIPYTWRERFTENLFSHILTPVGLKGGSVKFVLCSFAEAGSFSQLGFTTGA